MTIPIRLHVELRIGHTLLFHLERSPGPYSDIATREGSGLQSDAGSDLSDITERGTASLGTIYD